MPQVEANPVRPNRFWNKERGCACLGPRGRAVSQRKKGRKREGRVTDATSILSKVTEM